MEPKGAKGSSSVNLHVCVVVYRPVMICISLTCVCKRKSQSEAPKHLDLTSASCSHVHIYYKIQLFPLLTPLKRAPKQDKEQNSLSSSLVFFLVIKFGWQRRCSSGMSLVLTSGDLPLIRRETRQLLDSQMKLTFLFSALAVHVCVCVSVYCVHPGWYMDASLCVLVSVGV